MSSAKWKIKKIQDIGTVVGGGTPYTKKIEYYGGDITWITPKEFIRIYKISNNRWRKEYYPRGI